MKPQVRRLIIAILAWPAGILAALLVLLLSALVSPSDCTSQKKVDFPSRCDPICRLLGRAQTRIVNKDGSLARVSFWARSRGDELVVEGAPWRVLTRSS